VDILARVQAIIEESWATSQCVTQNGKLVNRFRIL
jgi:hypothetical protein